MMTGIEALKHAIVLLGSQGEVARAVGVKQPSVSFIVTKGERVPAEWCIPLEKATEGAVTRHDLRPDLYPIDDDAQTKGAAA